jgi:type IV pilus assembly protein PilN
MHLTINLATRSYVDVRKLYLAIIVAGVLLLTVLFFTGAGLISDTAEVNRLTEEIAVLDGKQRTTEKAVSAKDYQALLDRIRFANSVIDKKSANWLQLLDRFETVVPDGITLTAIEPDSRDQTVKVSGVALNFKKIRTLVETMESSKDFSAVYLTGQTEIRVADRLKGMTFSLTCKVAAR